MSGDKEFRYKGIKKNVDASKEVFHPNLNVDLGTYTRTLAVSNADSRDELNLGRAYFDQGLRHLLSYQHELASKNLLTCVFYAPYCALAHSLIAMANSPNYNFKGTPYYESTNHPEEENEESQNCIFPSQQLAARHSKIAVLLVENIRKLHRKGGKKAQKGKTRKTEIQEINKAEVGVNDGPSIVSDVETLLINAVRTLTCNPGIASDLVDEMVGRPFANAMRKIHIRYPDDPEIAYFLAEGLMVLNAWRLYDFPSGRPLSPDVDETRSVLESSLQKHRAHAGLIHMYVHLSEMSSTPEKALQYCGPLRNDFPMAGHLIHMPTHIDVLVGDYAQVVEDNCRAIAADDFCIQDSPDTAGETSFYFGYMVHNYHFAVYGALLGGMEAKAMEVATKLNDHLTEALFMEYPDVTAYLESYSALDLHVMIRFGRWSDILLQPVPKDKLLMLFRCATIAFARGLAFANQGDIPNAKKEADRFDSLRNHPTAKTRILHNNSVFQLLAVDAPMLRGEIAYHDGRYDEGFRLLRKSVQRQDTLQYDEPWGKIQPVRHSLGGLLLQQGHLIEAAEVFREDLKFHPKTPFSLIGLIQSLDSQVRSGLLDAEDQSKFSLELVELRKVFGAQRQIRWADFEIEVACECCKANMA